LAALRWSILGAVALIAAALGDVTVERFADTGVFGAAYVDHDQSAVGGTLVLGLGVALAVFVWRFGTLLGAASVRRRAAWHRATARALAPRLVVRTTPLVLIAQLAGVYGIESVERLALGAALPQGLGWLGAPPLLALAFYAVLCVVCTLVVTAALRALFAWCGALAAIVLAFVTALVAPEACLGARGDAPLVATRSGRARLHGERGPPLLPTFA
jgi:hypothetical protein